MLPADNMPCHFTAAFAAGFCTTLVASPVDVVKTRYMNSVQGQYRGALNCAMTMLLKEGPTAFYKGYGTCSTEYMLSGIARVKSNSLLFLSWQIRALVSSLGLLEHRDVCQLRADPEGRRQVSEVT